MANAEQICWFPSLEERVLTEKKADKKIKRSWEDAFQRWSDDQVTNGTDSYGVCGYGSMCDYCKENDYGRPCVRALNAMCRDKHAQIDYMKRDFEEVWNGGGTL